jgi:hypothetical protein
MNGLSKRFWECFKTINGSFFQQYVVRQIKHPSAATPLLQIFQKGEDELSLAACEVLMEFEDVDYYWARCSIFLRGGVKRKRKR